MTQRVADFDFQMQIWGYDLAGKSSPLDQIWEDTRAQRQLYWCWDYPGWWRDTVEINGDEPPEWMSLPAVVEAVQRGLLTVD